MNNTIDEYKSYDAYESILNSQEQDNHDHESDGQSHGLFSSDSHYLYEGIKYLKESLINSKASTEVTTTVLTSDDINTEVINNIKEDIKKEYSFSNVSSSILGKGDEINQKIYQNSIYNIMDTTSYYSKTTEDTNRNENNNKIITNINISNTMNENITNNGSNYQQDNESIINIENYNEYDYEQSNNVNYNNNNDNNNNDNININIDSKNDIHSNYNENDNFNDKQDQNNTINNPVISIEGLSNYTASSSTTSSTESKINPQYQETFISSTDYYDLSTNKLISTKSGISNNASTVNTTTTATASNVSTTSDSYNISTSPHSQTKNQYKNENENNNKKNLFDSNIQIRMNNNNNFSVPLSLNGKLTFPSIDQSLPSPIPLLNPQNSVLKQKINDTNTIGNHQTYKPNPPLRATSYNNNNNKNRGNNNIKSTIQNVLSKPSIMKTFIKNYNNNNNITTNTTTNNPPKLNHRNNINNKENNNNLDITDHKNKNKIKAMNGGSDMTYHTRHYQNQSVLSPPPSLSSSPSSITPTPSSPPSSSINIKFSEEVKKNDIARYQKMRKNAFKELNIQQKKLDVMLKEKQNRLMREISEMFDVEDDNIESNLSRIFSKFIKNSYIRI